MESSSSLLTPGLIENLRTSVHGSVLVRDDEEYSSARRVWNGAIDRYPAVLVRAADENDVVWAVRTARAHGLPLSVRGGGHDWDGRAVREGGVLIDLSGLRRVAVDPCSATAKVQGGTRAGDAVAAAGSRGLAPVTGTSKAVGLTGLTLGGGYGLLIGEHGLALDNLLDARVVLADGTAVTAGPDDHPDLLWALRGGGGNFGVVTAARFRLHPIRSMLAGLMVFPIAVAADVLHEYAEVVSGATDSLTVMAGFFSGADGQPALFLLPAWVGEDRAGSEALSRLRRLGSRLRRPGNREGDEIIPRTYGEVLGLFDGWVVDGRHNEMRTRSLPALSDGAIQALTAAASALTSPFSAIVLHHFHGAASRVPEGDTAFGPRRDHLLVEILASWDARDPDSGPHQRWARGTSAALEPFSLPGGYPNLLGSDERERALAAYGTGLERLTAIKRRFDPDNVFHAVPDLSPAEEKYSLQERVDPMTTVREATLQVFRDLGMTTIFSNPSHTEMKLFEEWPDDLRFIMGLQEASVVSMADGYAQATGTPPLVIINGGPGLGNAMGAIYTAASAHTPMVILGGQQARKMLLGEPFLKATEPTQLPKPYIKWSGEPARPQDVPELLVKAYHIANATPKGPVFVAVPEDDWVRPASPAPIARHTVKNAVAPDLTALAELADVLNGARRPGLIAGPAVDTQGGRGDLIALAEKTGAQVWGSPVWPRGSFPENHPLFAGVLPPIPEIITDRLSRHDVVVILGSPAFTLFTAADLFATHPADLDTSSVWNIPEGQRFFHVTDDPEAAAWSMAETSIIAPPGPAVRELIPLVERRERAQDAPPRQQYPVPEPSEPLTQAYLFHLLSQELPADAAIFEELPIARADFHEQTPLGPDNSYFATASGALGYPFAGAVGFALARPDRRAVVIVGEGSAQYTLHSLWTAAKHNLPVTYVIPNNSGYLSLKYYLEQQQAWKVGWDLSGVNMAALAQGFGVPGRRVESPDQLGGALKEAFSVDGPMLLDVVVADPGLFRL